MKTIGWRAGIVLAAILAVLYFWASTSQAGDAPADGARIVGDFGRQPGQFSNPRAVAITPDQELIVIDRTGRIQVFDATSGKFLRKWWLPAWENGTPTGMTLDLDNKSVWIADTHYQRILHYDLEGNLLSSWGEEGIEPGQMIFPTDVCPDPDGKTVWITEYGQRSRVMQYTREGEFIKEWGSKETEFSDLQRPMAVAIDKDGRLFVADAGNNCVRIFDRDGNRLDVWGEAGEEPGQLKYPYDLTIADDGTVYLCEYGNSRISHFTAGGKFLGIWGGPGYRPGQLFTPWGVAAGPEGELAIADTKNGRVQMVDRAAGHFRAGGES
ncbi:hypothetical protein KQI84_08050 [bacterium]|nr:hypothetical protein [bacterium]